MRENCSSGSVGERGGNEPLYPEKEKRSVKRGAKSKEHVRAGLCARPVNIHYGKCRDMTCCARYLIIHHLI